MDWFLYDRDLRHEGLKLDWFHDTKLFLMKNLNIQLI